MTVRRIVVATDTPGARAAMATAVDLARALNVDLLGLFIEDPALLALATLPFAREVGFPSSARRALDVAVMERGLRAQARRVERALADLVAGDALRWSFDVVRGRVSADLFATWSATDLAVVPVTRGPGATASSPARALHAYVGTSIPLLLVGDRSRRLASIAVVPADEVEAARVADIVAALAPRYGRSTLCIELSRAPPAGRESRGRTLERELASRGLAARLRAVGQPAEIAALMAQETSRVVVTLAGTPEARVELLDILGCPVLVLPSGRGRTGR